VKKIPVKPLRLVRQPIRVLTSRQLGQVVGGATPPTSDACNTVTQTTGSVNVTDTCG
jgi:hypothetical protein